MNRPPSAARAALKAAPPPAPAPVATPAPDLLLVGGGMFWEKYKLPIVAAVTLLILAIVGSEFYRIQQEKKLREASSQLEAAKSAADYQRIIAEFPGTMAAANATLLLGREQAEAKDYAGAGKTFREFADKFPQHMLAPVALIGAASALEAENKLDEARSLYERVGAGYPSSYAATLARLSEALLLKAQRKPEEARRIYENLMAASPDSEAAQQAAEELRFLHVVPSPAGTVIPGVTPAPVAASPTPSITLSTGAATPEPFGSPGPAANFGSPAPAAGSPVHGPSSPAPAASAAPAASPVPNPAAPAAKASP